MDSANLAVFTFLVALVVAVQGGLVLGRVADNAYYRFRRYMVRVRKDSRWL